jgi:uncharacterized protein (TIGR02996 family)
VWRRFELGTKYWEAEHDGARVEMRWGEAGAPQKTFSRRFSSEQEAELFFERQILGQRERGYAEIERVAQVPVGDLIVERFQRFERSGHFIEIAQEGKKLTVRGGRVVDGRDQASREQLDVQHLASVADASAAFDARCSNARHEGGRAVEAEPMHATAIDADLERECEASPDNAAPWAVYADWLIAQGDARGEIAALHAAGKIAEAKRRLGMQIGELCGTDGGRLAFEYRHGFATHCTISVDVREGEDLLEDVTRAVLASPMGRFLESLQFGLAAVDEENDWAPTLHVVAASPRAPYIRALQFAGDLEKDQISLIPYGDFSGVWHELPALERLRIQSGDGGTLGLVEHANLRVLIRESGGLRLSEIDEILAARLPNLEHLEIWFGQLEYGSEGRVSSIRRILDGEGYPALQHLGIVNCEFIDHVIPELARSGILKQLRSLDFSRSVMAEDATASLIANAAAFRALASIDVSENLLSEANLRRLRAVLPNIVSREQRDHIEGDDRFAAIGE